MFKWAWGFSYIGTEVHLNTHMWSMSENPFVKLHNHSPVQVRGRIIIIKDEEKSHWNSSPEKYIRLSEWPGYPKGKPNSYKDFLKVEIRKKWFFSPPKQSREKQTADIINFKFFFHPLPAVDSMHLPVVQQRPTGLQKPSLSTVFCSPAVPTASCSGTATYRISLLCRVWWQSLKFILQCMWSHVMHG